MDNSEARRKAAEDFLDGVKWKNELMTKRRRDDSLEIIPNHPNAVILLSQDPDWRMVIGYNQFRQRIEKRKSTPYKGAPGPWSDWDTAETIIQLSQRHGVVFSRDLLDFAVMTVANRQAFNPAQERLRALAEQWDGIQRLVTWLEENLNAIAHGDNREYLAEIGAAWLKGVCARVLIPGCKRDDVLVTLGEQGWLKSTAAQAIADCIMPDSFTDSVDLGNVAEAKIQIRGIIIAELSELAGMARGEIETIKAFVSTKTDHFREKYGKHSGDFPRTVSFIGTSNDATFLKDSTGNRRWWPVPLAGPIDIELLKSVLPQLLGEAARAVLNGEPWHVTASKALRQAALIREDHFDEDTWTDDVLRIVGTLNPEFFTITEIFDAMFIARAQQTKLFQMRLGSILRVTGHVPTSRREGGVRKQRGWRKGTQT